MVELLAITTASFILYSHILSQKLEWEARLWYTIFKSYKSVGVKI